jgi:hypothetical protein
MIDIPIGIAKSYCYGALMWAMVIELGEDESGFRRTQKPAVFLTNEEIFLRESGIRNPAYETPRPGIVKDWRRLMIVVSRENLGTVSTQNLSLAAPRFSWP